jgi:hypothetical protein
MKISDFNINPPPLLKDPERICPSGAKSQISNANHASGVKMRNDEGLKTDS